MEQLQSPARLPKPEFREALQTVAFEKIEIRKTHRVHEHPAAAIIRARKPVHR